MLARQVSSIGKALAQKVGGGDTGGEDSTECGLSPGKPLNQRATGLSITQASLVNQGSQETLSHAPTPNVIINEAT